MSILHRLHKSIQRTPALTLAEVESAMRERPFDKLTAKEQYYALLYKVLNPIRQLAMEDVVDIAYEDVVDNALPAQIKLAESYYASIKDAAALQGIRELKSGRYVNSLLSPFVVGAVAPLLHHVKHDLPLVALPKVCYEIATASFVYGRTEAMTAAIRQLVEQPYFKEALGKVILEYEPLTRYVSDLLRDAQKADMESVELELPTPWPLTNGFMEISHIGHPDGVPHFSGIEEDCIRDWTQFSRFVDSLADSGYIARDVQTKLNFTYVMTGRCYDHFHPKSVLWLKHGDITPLYWIRKYMFTKANYNAICEVFPAITSIGHHTERYSAECKALISTWFDMWPSLKSKQKR